MSVTLGPRRRQRRSQIFLIITPNELTAIQPDYFHFAILNLAEKSRRQIASVLLAAHCRLYLEEAHQRDHFSCGHWTIVKQRSLVLLVHEHRSGRVLSQLVNSSAKTTTALYQSRLIGHAVRR